MIEELEATPQPEVASEQHEADSLDSANEEEWVEVGHGDAGSPPAGEPANPAAPAEEEAPAIVEVWAVLMTRGDDILAS